MSSPATRLAPCESIALEMCMVMGSLQATAWSPRCEYRSQQTLSPKIQDWVHSCLLMGLFMMEVVCKRKAAMAMKMYTI